MTSKLDFESIYNSMQKKSNGDTNEFIRQQISKKNMQQEIYSEFYNNAKIDSNYQNTLDFYNLGNFQDLIPSSYIQEFTKRLHACRMASSAASFGSRSGYRLQNIVYQKLNDVYHSHKNLKILKTEQRHASVSQNFDLYIERTDGKFLGVFIQKDLWDGGQQVNRLENYSKKVNSWDSTEGELYLLVSSRLRIKPPKQKNSKAEVYNHINNCMNNLIYFEELLSIVDKFLNYEK